MKRKSKQPMYYIKKYADCWAVHNDHNGNSRPLNEEECKKVKDEFPSLADSRVRTVFTDQIRSLDKLP